MDTITLQGIPCYGYHGCLPEEQKNGQPFYMDIVLYVPLQKAGQSDDLHDTIDYSAVYRLVRDIAEGRPYHLIERLAAVIAEHILADFPQAVRVGVTVHKPHAPVGGPIGDVALTIERGRP